MAKRMTTTRSPRRRHEYTSAAIGRLAAKGAKDPYSISIAEIQAVCASALTQRPTRKRAKP